MSARPSPAGCVATSRRYLRFVLVLPQLALLVVLGNRIELELLVDFVLREGAFGDLTDEVEHLTDDGKGVCTQSDEVRFRSHLSRIFKGQIVRAQWNVVPRRNAGALVLVEHSAHVHKR